MVKWLYACPTFRRGYRVKVLYGSMAKVLNGFSGSGC